MIEHTLTIEVSEQISVTAVLTRPETCRRGVTPGLVLAHGMDNDLRHPLLEAVAHRLAAEGAASVLRFNFPYAERRVKTPDRNEVLEAAYRRAHDALTDDEVCPPGPVFLGGKSLGARVAAELVSRGHEGEGLVAAGLVFLGYPLHAPDGKDSLRLGPLRRIAIPTLFVEGSRDPFCDLALLTPVVAGLDHPGEVHVVADGNHSFAVPKRSGRTSESVYAEIADRVAAFIAAASEVGAP